MFSLLTNFGIVFAFFSTKALMTSNEVLSMYERIAGLTGRMVEAARSGDWDGLSHLEVQCAAESHRMEGCDVSALTGALRLHKLHFVKLILANDREIRAITEPWMAQIVSVVRGSAGTHPAAR